MASVVVVGGGISGLAAAYELSRARVPFTLLEASPRLGGLIRTETVGEYLIDAGPDAILAQKPGGLDLCRELGIADRLIPATPPRRAFVVRAGRLHPLPEGTVLGVPTDRDALARSTLFSLAERERIVREWSHPPEPSTPEDAESLGAFFRRRFGNEAADYLAEPLLAGIHTGDVDRLSVALFPRLTAAAKTGSVSRAFAGELSGAGPDGPFRSFPRGLQELVDALVCHLGEDAVRTGCAVERIERQGDRLTLQLRQGDPLLARAVVLAVPAYTAAAILRGLDPPLADACASIPHVSSGIVVLAYPRAAVTHPLDGSGFVVPRVEHQFEILAATWLSSKWPGRAPGNTVLMRAFFGGARHPECTGQPDDAIVARAHRDLSRLLGISAEPLLARVYRWTNATPQYEVGFSARLGDIRERLASHRGLFVTGPGFGTIGIPECIAAARGVARAI